MTACGQPVTPATSALVTTVATAAVLTSEPTVTPTTMPTNVPTILATNTSTTRAATPQPESATSVPEPAAEQAKIKLFAFQPSPLEITVGNTVTWTNRDAVEHSVTSGTPSDPSGVFDSGFFTEGQRFSYTFTQPGTYPFFCARHPTMMGQVVVRDQ